MTIKNFCASKNTTKKAKRRHTGWDENFPNHLSDNRIDTQNTFTPKRDGKEGRVEDPELTSHHGHTEVTIPCDKTHSKNDVKTGRTDLQQSKT